ERIRAPLLVIHGANDPRVPIGEAEQMVARLKALGRTVEFLRLEDEGHQIAKLANKLVAYPLAVDFLKRHLLRDCAPRITSMGKSGGVCVLPLMATRMGIGKGLGFHSRFACSACSAASTADSEKPSAAT